MSKISKEDEDRAKKMLEEYKRARKDTKTNPPVRVHQKDKWGYPPGEGSIGEMPAPDEADDEGTESEGTPPKKP